MRNSSAPDTELAVVGRIARHGHLSSANSLIGPILGAAFFLTFRDVLSDFTEHWMLFFGPLLVAGTAAEGRDLGHAPARHRRRRHASRA
jgi:hypothetical protein